MSNEVVFPGQPERPANSEWKHELIEVAGLTDVGLVRAKNEDSFFVADPRLVDISRGVMMVVADGMGGHVAGEIASQTAVDHLRTFYADTLCGESPEQHVGRKVLEANENLLALAQASSVLEGMGTTLTVGLIQDDEDRVKLVICHVGDSRLYLLRDGQLESQTNDHSFVGEQVRLGLLTEAEARIHPARNIITRALGIRAVVEPETLTVILRPNDRILLASDGLHGYVEDEEIREALAESPCAAEACARLVNLALDVGGMDNVTVVVAFVRAAGRLIESLGRTYGCPPTEDVGAPSTDPRASH